jgi:hypothetical protein
LSSPSLTLFTPSCVNHIVSIQLSRRTTRKLDTKVFQMSSNSIVSSRLMKEDNE